MSDQIFEEVRSMRAGAIPLSLRTKAALGMIAVVRGVPIPIDQRKKFIDVSGWNGLMDYGITASRDARGVYMRATYGSSYVDSQYNIGRVNALGAGEPFGSYGFLVNANGTDQGQHFVATMGLNPGAFPPCLDVEVAMDSLVIKQAVGIVHAAYGSPPIIYTSYACWLNVTGVWKQWVADHCELWVAHWGTDSPWLPSNWNSRGYIGHQYSADKNGLGFYYGATAPGAEPDMDMSNFRKEWYDRFVVAPPHPTLEERVASLETRVAELEEAVFPPENIER